WDRLARLWERQMQLTSWGPLLDHGVGFCFDCHHHLLYTNDLATLREVWPRLLRFADYLRSIRRRDGMLPVWEIGMPSVWIDHVAFRRQRDKRCAFNLYAAAAMKHALAPLAQALGDGGVDEAMTRFGDELLAATVRTYWDAGRGLFVNNLPFVREDNG